MKFGFNWQNYLDGACGKYSLRHALLLLGIPSTKSDVTQATGLPGWLTMLLGTDEWRIKEALKYFACRPIEFKTKAKRVFKFKIDKLLISGCPVIVSVQNDNLWIVICGKRNKDEYYYIDSADSELISHFSWNQLVSEINSDIYYLIGVKPYYLSHLKHSLVHNFRYVEKILNRGDTLFQWWVYYLNDLIKIFELRSHGQSRILADEFFRKYRKLICNKISSKYPNFDREILRWEYNNYFTVAELHNLTLSKNRVEKAIHKFTLAYFSAIRETY